MLRTGAITYSETLYTSQDLLQKLTPKGTQGTIFDKNICNIPNEDVVSLRQLERVLTKPIFRILLYCTLIGVNVSISRLYGKCYLIGSISYYSRSIVLICYKFVLIN